MSAVYILCGQTCCGLEPSYIRTYTGMLHGAALADGAGHEGDENNDVMSGGVSDIKIA